jgi:hypothetical protein
MSSADRISTADLPDSRMPANCGRFSVADFQRELEADFRRAHFDENLLHTRVNLCLR